MTAVLAFFVGPIGRWLVIAALVASAVFTAAVHERNVGWNERDLQAKAELLAMQANYNKQVAAIQAKQQEVITKTVTVYRDRIQVVKEKADAIVAEIPEILPLTSTLLSGGVRVIHDAAALGNLPDDPQGAARSAAPVETFALLTTVAENYAACTVNAERLKALQTIVSSLEQK